MHAIFTLPTLLRFRATFPIDINDGSHLVGQLGRLVDRLMSEFRKHSERIMSLLQNSSCSTDVALGTLLNYWNNFDQPLLNCFDSITSPTCSLPVIPVIQQRPLFASLFYGILQKALIYGKAEVDQYYVAPCKATIDKIDRALSEHYGFTDQELDFIINYDIKYRMGREALRSDV